ncbi:MAG: carbohydrate ABC transporter permease [Flexilinea sp.]
MDRKKKRILSMILILFTVIVILVIFDMGVFTNVLTSFKSNTDISSYPPKWVFKPVLTHYQHVFSKGGYNFGQYLTNSLIIAIFSTIFATLITIPAAYSIVRYHGFGEIILGATMLLRLMPALALAIPVFLIFNKVNLIDTRISIIFMHTLFIMPTSLLLFIGYIQDLPREIEEAAEMDGANIIQILTKIMIPVIQPGIASTAILGFITSWNEYLFSSILSFKKAITATVGTSFFITSYQVEWGPMAAAITISSIPTIIFIFIAQRALVRGITAGSVKG